MLEKTIDMRVLHWFFTHPTTPTGLRELTRALDVSLPSVSNAINELEQHELVTVHARKPVARIQANRNTAFIRAKRIANLEQLYTSQLIDAIQDAHPSAHAIICYGSYARGEDDEKSDIDIAVTTPVNPDFTTEPYETRLHRTIHLTSLHNAPELLVKNINNGVIMQGAL